MNRTKKIPVAELKRIRALEITKAYAEHKMRITGDLDSDLANWTNNLTCFIEYEKAKGKASGIF